MVDERQGLGFAGFGDMVSDVSDIVAQNDPNTNDGDYFRSTAAQTTRPSLFAKWKTPLIWTAIVVGLISLIYRGNQNKVNGPPPPEEVVPAVGTNNLLSQNEIRYCQAQSIRLDGAQTVVNRESTFDLNSYNAMIADYNSRCGNFRYRQEDLDAIKVAIASNWQHYFSEGVVQFSTGHVGPRAFR